MVGRGQKTPTMTHLGRLLFRAVTIHDFRETLCTDPNRFHVYTCFYSKLKMIGKLLNHISTEDLGL